MNNANDVEIIRRFLEENHVLALCAHADGQLWSANCFYVTDAEAMCLYFMTELKTLHGALMAKNPEIVGTIATQPENIALIRGIQYRGQAIVLEGSADENARALYCQQFLIAAKMKAPVWQLRFDDIKMTDNTLGFGTKLFWTRKEGSRKEGSREAGSLEAGSREAGSLEAGSQER